VLALQKSEAKVRASTGLDVCVDLVELASVLRAPDFKQPLLRIFFKYHGLIFVQFYYPVGAVNAI
jgi:hypothetical protein